jgi:hypothetical protein
MSLFNRKQKEAPAKKKEPDTITLYASDDLMTRAEKIVWMVGYRGAIGGYVLDMYRLLQTYERLDRESALTATKGQK